LLDANEAFETFLAGGTTKTVFNVARFGSNYFRSIRILMVEQVSGCEEYELPQPHR